MSDEVCICALPATGAVPFVGSIFCCPVCETLWYVRPGGPVGYEWAEREDPDPRESKG